MEDFMDIVGSVDVSQAPTGIKFDLLNPNNPVYMLEIPGLEDEPFFISGEDTETLQKVFNKLNLSIDVDISTGDEDNPSEPVNLKFKNLSDFEFETIVKSVKSLQNTQSIINALEKLVDETRLENNPRLIKLLENPQLREAMVLYLDDCLRELNNVN